MTLSEMIAKRMPSAQIVLRLLPVRLNKLRTSGLKMRSSLWSGLDKLTGRRRWALCLLLLSCQSSHAQEARFNLTNLNVSQAAAVLQDFTGQAVVLSSDVAGSITLFSSKPLDKREALVLFANALRAQGLTLHSAAGEIMVARSTSLSPRTARERDSTIETRIFTFQHLGVAEVSPAVRALLSPQGAISAKNNNTLFVSDRYSELLGITQYLMAANSAKERSSAQLECKRVLDAAGVLQRDLAGSLSKKGLDAASNELLGKQLHALVQALEDGVGCEKEAPSTTTLEKRAPRVSVPDLLNQATRPHAPEPHSEGLMVPKVKTAIEQPALRLDMTALPDDATIRALWIALENWRQAWASRDLTAYFSLYAPHFLPASESNSDVWKKKRKAVLARAVDVSIDITDLALTFPEATHATMVFTQTYRAKNYRDIVTKTLQWINVEGRWLIARESVVNRGSGAEVE